MIANKLLEIKAVYLRPHNWFQLTAEGLKGPMYVDNRKTLSFPKTRNLIIDEMVKKTKMEFPDAEFVLGVAAAGIQHAALVADRLNLPAGYARNKPKGYGRTNKIEGKIIKGQKVVIIEDLIVSGASTFNAYDAAIEAGAEVLGTLVIYTYNVPAAHKAFKSKGMKLVSLTNFNTLIPIAIKKGYISKEDSKIIYNWKEDFDKQGEKW